MQKHNIAEDIEWESYMKRAENKSSNQSSNFPTKPSWFMPKIKM